MTDTEKKTDEDKSNEMLKRMLETPPSPKEKAATKVAAHLLQIKTFRIAAMPNRQNATLIFTSTV